MYAICSQISKVYLGFCAQLYSLADETMDEGLAKIDDISF